MDNAPRITRRKSVRDRNNIRVDRYYLTVSGRFRAAKLLCLLMLVIMLLSMISIYRDEITVENLQYLVKYLNKDAPEYTGKYRDIYFDDVSDIQLGTYKGDLAAVSSTSVKLYNMLGNSTLSYPIKATDPVLLTSGQYMLVYAMGENYFSVNNSFSKLYSEETEFPVTGAALSDSGMFAIVSKTTEYRGAVYFYDKNFSQVSRILKDKLIMSCAINGRGDKAAVVSAYSSDGEFVSEIMTLNPHKSESDAVFTINDALAVKVFFNSDGGYTVICDNRVLFFNKDDEKTAEYLYSGLTLINCYAGADQTVLIFNINVIGNDNTAIFFSNDGREKSRCRIHGQVIDVCSDDRYAYVLTESQILKIDTENADLPESTESVQIGNGSKKIMLKDPLTLMLCGSHSARSVSISDLFPPNGEEAVIPDIGAEKPDYIIQDSDNAETTDSILERAP